MVVGLDAVCATFTARKGAKDGHLSFSSARPLVSWVTKNWHDALVKLNATKESVCLLFEMQSDEKSTRKKLIILSHLKHKLVNKYLSNTTVCRHCTGQNKQETCAVLNPHWWTQN